MKLLLIACSFIACFTTSIGQSEIRNQLFEMPDVIFEEIQTPENYQSAYELKIKQPIDHDNPDEGFFYQRVWLSHAGFDNPTVMITNGYGAPNNRIAELSTYLQANQISIEHRYFLESSPDKLDYDYLTFEQVTADLHRINILFKEMYTSKWISSGISKGGTTTIFYRYFYPDDVDVSVPYVAPIILSKEDKRIYEFFDTIGTEECRSDIEEFQTEMFVNADDYKNKLKWFYKGKDLNFNYLSFDEAFELAVLEYPFSFWQYGHDCNGIPEKKNTDEEKLEHFIEIVGMDLFSDRDVARFGSHYYQAGTQMGYYGYELDDFSDYINYLPKDKNPSAVFMPDKIERPFDGKLTKQVYNWALTAEKMVYINGALDTWSAAAIPVNDKVNSLYYFMEGKDHGNARISNMTDEQLQLLKQKLIEWLAE